MGASVVLGCMEQTGLWGYGRWAKQAYGPNRSIGGNDAWSKPVYRPTGRTGNRMYGCTARSFCDKRGTHLWYFAMGFNLDPAERSISAVLRYHGETRLRIAHGRVLRPFSYGKEFLMGMHVNFGAARSGAD